MIVVNYLWICLWIVQYAHILVGCQSLSLLVILCLLETPEPCYLAHIMSICGPLPPFLPYVREEGSDVLMKHERSVASGLDLGNRVIPICR